MPKLPVEQRLKGFEEVNLGFNPEMVAQEVKRCLCCGISCMQVWRGEKTYAELPSHIEDVMQKGLHDYERTHEGAHPQAAYRLPKGKKSAAILVYYQMGEHRYQVIEDCIRLNLATYMGTEVIDIITAYPMLKAGDVLKNADLMERAFKTGQMLC